MKIRIGSGLLLLNLLVIVLIPLAIFSPSSSPYDILRIILGLPLVLLFPGYALVAVLFPRREGLDNIERIALSFGLSIAIVSLIGLTLNYTPPGINLESVLYSVSGFTFIMSLIAVWRRAGLIEEDRFNISSGSKLPSWSGGVLGKLLSILLAISIAGALGMLSYVLASPKAAEKFTEFYILKPYSASDYPAEFVIAGGEVILVKYGDNEILATSTGRVTLAIVNHEHEKATYLIKVMIDDELLEVSSGGEILEHIGPVILAHEEKWEQEIGFVPQHGGDNQKVDFILYKDGATCFEEPLHLWFDVTFQD